MGVRRITAILLLVLITFLLLPMSSFPQEKGELVVLTFDLTGDLLAEVKIYLNGELVEETPPEGYIIFEVEPGEYRIEVEKSGYQPEKREIVVEEDQMEQVRFELRKERNEKPFAKVSYSPKEPKVGEKVIFVASDSHDPDGEIEKYKWDLDGDGRIDKTGEKVTYIFKSPGKHSVELRVVDADKLSGSSSQIVKVSEKEEPSFEEINFPTFSRGAQDPIIRQMDNGEIWLFAHYAENWQVFYVKSSDGGNTWSEPRQLSPGPYGCYNIDVAQTQSGKIFVIWNASPENQGYDLYYRTTTDHGETWSKIQKIPTPEEHSTVPSIVTFPNSKIIIAWGNHYIVSTDGGRTWTRARTLKEHSGAGTLSRTTEGDYILINRKSDIGYRFSYDGGNEWTERRRISSVTVPSDVPAIRPIPKLLESSDGRLWATWHGYQYSSKKSWNDFSDEYTEGATQVWYAVRERGFLSWDVKQITTAPHYHGNSFSDVGIAQLGEYIWVVYSVYDKEEDWQIGGKRIGKVD